MTTKERFLTCADVDAMLADSAKRAAPKIAPVVKRTIDMTNAEYRRARAAFLGDAPPYEGDLPDVRELDEQSYQQAKIKMISDADAAA